MKRILFAWEMGSNFGHVNKVSQVAAQLQGEMDVTFAARNVIAVRDLAPNLEARLLQAPYSPMRAPTQHEMTGACYPGLLLLDGWDQSKRLIPLIESWRALFDLVQPDVLVTQAAPTALLAAHGLGLKTALLGSGWDAPPRANPMPCLSPDDPEAVALAAQQESDVLTQANLALAHHNAPKLEQFSDLLDVEEYLLVAYPESDHFAPRHKYEAAPAPYLGQLLSVQTGQHMTWRTTGLPRIFAYLRPGSGPYNAAVQGLSQLGPDADIILAAPGIDPVHAESLRARNVQICDGPARLDKLLPDCDLGISHGSNGIGSAFLAFGVPQIGLPGHREQMMFTQAVARAGCALGVAGSYAGPQIVEAVQKALNSVNLKERAHQIKDKIASEGLKNPAQKAADILRELAAS
ncbi:MAG: nucleotide disphospho-sugar-binding domain-containing protein [Aliishimia sp.]